MRIYNLEINNFRGIKTAKIYLGKTIACLIGPGDSTKSTILDAIEYVLSPNWFIPFDDSDFTYCDHAHPIEIQVTIGPVQGELIPDNKFGLFLRGWDVSDKIIHDEPEEEDIRVLTIKLKIDADLTPEWSVITDRDEKNISNRDRQRFGITRIGKDIDNDLSWARGSSLLRLTADKKDAEQQILEANRQLREFIGKENFDGISDSISSANNAAIRLGVKCEKLRAHIDPQMLKGGAGALSLHENLVPFRRMGLGSKRLMAIGIQLECVNEGAILLIDEFENALEPHRLKHALRDLQYRMKSETAGQILLTTHSPSVLVELGAEPILCIHNDSKQKTIAKDLDEKSQGTVRCIPEAFLSPRVIVCEGATEVGILRAFESALIEKNDWRSSFALNGIIAVDGGGQSAPKRGFDLKSNNYDVCLFMDSDDVINWTIPETQLIEMGIKVIRWSGDACTEARIINDLPQKHFNTLIEKVIEINGRTTQSIIDSINSNLYEVKLNCIEDVKEYNDKVILRQAMIKSALKEKREWFKTVHGGETVGDFIFSECFQLMELKDFYIKLQLIKDWVNAN